LNTITEFGNEINSRMCNNIIILLLLFFEIKIKINRVQHAP